jgi:hypothetical protein
MTHFNTQKNHFHQSQQTYQQDKFLPLLCRLPPNIWSEPFVDSNDNKQRDDDEVVYLDDNDDGQFTENALSAPPDDNDMKRFVGLLDRYQENNWWRWRVNQATWEDLYPVEKPEGTPVDPEEALPNPAE